MPAMLPAPPSGKKMWIQLRTVPIAAITMRR
jgi:hypothetical protein